MYERIHVLQTALYMSSVLRLVEIKGNMFLVSNSLNRFQYEKLPMIYIYKSVLL